LTSRGCRHVSWQDWLHAECVDPIQADAQIALASAPTERAAAILVDQYHGALASVVGSIVAAATAGNWAVVSDRLHTLLQYRDVGLHLVSPWRVVLTGRTNVGKSSLINALAGFERAIVSNQPGTTRDVITTTTAIDGWPVQLTDTAGLRAPADELEAAGVRLAIDTLQTADLIVAVEDAASISKSSAREHNKLSTVIADVRSTRPMICVHNKIDLVPPVDRTNRRPDDDGRCEVVFTSAITGEGIAELIAVIGRTLVPVVPPAGGAVPFTTGQIGALDAACDAAKRRDAEGVVAALQPLLAR
jgi:tRNA modification GTPase